jgi:hypothetical protein
MLIYTISLTLQSAMFVTIDNQCTNIELTSPAHFIKVATCHGHFPQVNPKSSMKVNLKIDASKDTFGGALLYHLQRKMDTSMSTQLLIIWEFRIDRFYSHTWLIEHGSAFIWNEDMLKRLYDKYDSQHDTDIILNTEKWLLDDNTKIEIVCKALSEGDFEMNIIISEEKDLCHPIRPLWVDLNR